MHCNSARVRSMGSTPVSQSFNGTDASWDAIWMHRWNWCHELIVEDRSRWTEQYTRTVNSAFWFLMPVIRGNRYRTSEACLSGRKEVVRTSWKLARWVDVPCSIILPLWKLFSFSPAACEVLVIYQWHDGHARYIYIQYELNGFECAVTCRVHLNMCEIAESCNSRCARRWYCRW